MSRILIVEDEKAIRTVLSNILKEENDSYEILEAEDGMQAIKIISKEELDLVICDIKMPKMDGIEVLEKSMKEDSSLPFLMISGHGDIDTAIQSIKIGAFDYISKPPDLNLLLNAVKNGLDRKNLIEENKNLQKENNQLKSKISERYRMVGESQALKNITTMVDRVAPTEARVLITGSNGSGKELVAHQIHQKGNRNRLAMVEVNCAAIPSELIESELFGHVKGSFTGAVKDKAGKFEQANGSTLFLDEIGDMSLSAQAKVLRALQEGKITRVGGDKSIKVDVRVLAATNKDLKAEIGKGNFREDLYHRLAVILIHVPPLKERIEDIPLLVERFNIDITDAQGSSPKKFEDAAIAELQKSPWTGNIRELRNVIERLIILCGDEISAQDVKTFAPQA